MTMNVPGYDTLASILQRAYDQAARGKGAERHANELPFAEQPMQTIADKHGVGFLLGQVDKKVVEAHGMLRRGELEKAVHELLGAINYTAGAILFVEGTPEAKTEARAKPETGAAPESQAKTDETGECGCPACRVRRLLQADEVVIAAESDDERSLLDFIQTLERIFKKS